LKILILKPSSLGDVVHALPVLRLLKLHWPQSEIFWWLEAGLVPLLEGDPDLSGLYSFERRRWAAPRQWFQFWQQLREIRRQRFDWVIDLQGLARSGAVAWLANAGSSIGLDNPREGAREGARAFYDLTAPRSPAGTHAVERYLSVLPALGVPVDRPFQWLPPRPEIAARVRKKWDPGAGRWVVLLPGARWETKRWPVEYFVELTRELLVTAPDVRCAVLGSAEDNLPARLIARADPARCLDLTGQTSLCEMIEWVRLSCLMITNDTGPLHVAAALDKPVVAIFGPSDPDSTGPYRQRDRVMQNTSLPCVPCLKDRCSYVHPLECLRSITPAMVCAVARQRLAGLSAAA
jgi:lipopolysaccharide heptosyltransferase I